MPRYTDATHSGDSIVLHHVALREVVASVSTGFGWSVYFTPASRLMGVLEHFGEVRYPGSMIPTRMEAREAVREEGDFGTRLRFALTQTTWAAMARRSSIHGRPYARDDGREVNPQFDGELVLTLHPTKPVVTYFMRCRAMETVCFSSIRGPWLLAGANSFGGKKDDAIFPGIDWCVGEEWSSGTDHFRHPWALRMAPDPLKVAAPFMGVSEGGDAIALTWNPDRVNRYHWEHHYVQPVFASPNFIDRRSQHLMGLMFPAAMKPHRENALESDEGIAFLLGMEAAFEGEIRVGKGDTLDLMSEWISEKGLPPPPEPRYELEDALDRIARAYAGHLWHDGKGWGTCEADATPHVPYFAAAYIECGRDRAAANALAANVERARALRAADDRAGLVAKGEAILARQRPDGSFGFDPEGVHGGDMRTANYVYCDDTHRPLGHVGETALDLCVDPAGKLLDLHARTGDARFLDAARKALDFCLPLRRPEGGDWWETPLKSPNLLAAGHAAVAYALGERATGDERYRAAAVHWIRAVLPFTNLWQPREFPMLYNTKPCFTATCWQLSNWVTWQVQWEVLQTFALSRRHGIDWAAMDPAIDWARYRDGVTIAALRWMVDHEDPKDTVLPPDLVLSGKIDTLYHDVFDVTTGKYSGALILPDPIAENLQAMLEDRAR